MDPNVGLDLEASKNLNSLFKDKVFYASLPANCYFGSDIAILSMRFS